MKRRFSILTILLPLGVFLLHSCNPAEELVVTDNITGSVTWTNDNIYIIEGSLSMNEGSELIIEPGTTIKFGAGGSLTVGYNSNTTFIADGNKKHPITFTSSSARPDAGAWEGIIFYSNTLQNSIMDNCIVEYAGVENYGAIRLLNCTITMDSCTITDCAGMGIYCDTWEDGGGFKTFTNNTIKRYEQYAIEIGAGNVSVIDTTNHFEGDGGILVTGSYNSDSPQTWKKLDVPYIIESSLSVNGTLTIDPGCILQFNNNGELVLGYSENTTFIADGKSATTPITFTSTASNPTAGAWTGITFYGGTLSNSKLNFCNIEYAGTQMGAVDVLGVKVTITNCSITNSDSYGVSFEGDEAGAVAFTNNTINTCADHPIYIHSTQVPTLGVPNDITAGSYKGIYVRGNADYEAPVTWRKQNPDFYMEGSPSLNGDVTFEAGSVFHFGSDGGFVFGYSNSTRLSAQGTTTAPIVFTSAAAVPAAGAWEGITFYDNTTANSVMDHCIIEYCGDNNQAGILTWANLTVSNSEINEYAATPAKKRNTVTVSGSGNNFTWVDM